MQINFISSKDSGETQTMDTKSNNMEIMMGSETDDIITEIIDSFLQRYQEGLVEKMRGNEFVFKSVDLLYYSLYKANLRNTKQIRHAYRPKYNRKRENKVIL